jgi:pimeloyl-ACP methyl ester carboxylesterase
MSFVLVPGAGGAPWYWHRVVPELQRRGADVVAVDLPADDDLAGLPEYADAIVDAAGEREGIVLVAQSMAGFSAPMVCARLPVEQLVLVNAMIPRPGETPGEWWADTGQEQARRENDAREGRDPDADFDLATYFLHDLPPDVLESASGNDRPQSNAVFSSRWPLTEWPDVPTRVLVARGDRFFPADFQRRVAEDRLGITPDEIDGGHLVALQHPREVAGYVAGSG